MPKDTTAPAGSGGHNRTISGWNSTPKPPSTPLTEAPFPQETQERQERQDTQGVSFQRGETDSCASCVNNSSETEGSNALSTADDGSCASCVRPQGGVTESDFRRFLKRAAERSAEDVLKHRGSPRAEDYRSPSLLFARCLKGHQELACLDAEAATERIDQELDLMFPNHPAPWVGLGLLDVDSRNHACDPRSDFLDLWGRILTPFEPGGPVHDAARRAEEKPLDFGGRFGRPADAAFRKLLSICYWLSRDAGGEFFLACRVAGDVLDVSHTAASKLIRRAEASGFLQSVGTYTEKDRARRHAKTWQFQPPEPLRFLD